jgi:hypothetical protein
MWKGLRLTAYVDHDAYVQDAERSRFVGQVTFEHPVINIGVDYLKATDQTSRTKPQVDAKGYSVWVNPRMPGKPWEVLLRHDELTPNETFGGQKRKRDIVGVSYWVPNLNKVTAALMLDYDSLKQSGFVPARVNDTRYGLKMLINF